MILPPKTLATVKSYFDGRDNQSTAKWDKEKCLDEIETAAFSEGFKRMEACAGTFWLTSKEGDTRWTVKFDDGDYQGELTPYESGFKSNALGELGFGA